MLLLFVTLIAAASADKARIIGGNVASALSHPHQLSLQFGNSHTCGAVLVHPDYALTAAHCTYGRDHSQFRVVVNEQNLNTVSGEEINITITEIYEHENYDGSVSETDGAFPYDIAVLVLSSSAPIENVIAMPEQGSYDSFIGSPDCVISGWGRTENSGNGIPNELHETAIDVLSEAACKKQWGNYVNENHVCVYTAGKGACNGDSGGPLTCEANGTKYIVGLASWVANGCYSSSWSGIRTTPSAYANVAHFRDWINGKIL